MAIYHLSLKKGKKPDGKKLKAIDHVEYINREGVYKDIDRKTENRITTSQKKWNLLYNGEPIILYKSDFGNIISDSEGLRITGNASPITIGIAMMIANDIFPGDLVVHGSKKFEENVIVAGSNIDYPLVFHEQEINQKIQKRKECIANVRQRFYEHGGHLIAGGSEQLNGFGDPVRGIGGVGTNFTESDPAKGIGQKQSISQLSSVKQSSMLKLPVSSMDDTGQGKSAMLLQGIEVHQLENKRADRPANVRWDVLASQRKLAEETAKKIIHKVKEYHEQYHSTAHVYYLNREKAFAKKGGCVHTESKLPPWAEGSAAKFFSAADRYERKNSNRYLEFQMALPNELSMEQNLELIHKFIDKVIPDHYYHFAVHDKISALSDTTHNLHVHLMFTERMIDDVEKVKPRAASHFFTRCNPNAKDMKERRLCGSPKESRINNKKFLIEARKDFADITNEILAKYNKPSRVDHRSLKARYEEALLDGDTYLASLLQRVPEKSLGPTAMLVEWHPEVAAVKESRKQREILRDEAFSKELNEKNFLAKNLDKTISYLEKRLQKIENDPAYNEINISPCDEPDALALLKEALLDAKEDFQKCYNVVLSTDEAVRQGTMAYIYNDDDKDIFARYYELTDKLAEWEKFLQDMKKASEDSTEYLPLLPELDKKISSLESERKNLEPAIKRINENLNNTPSLKMSVQDYTHRLLKENRPYLFEAKKACEHLQTSLESMEHALKKNNELEVNAEEYTTQELYNILLKKLYGYNKEYQKTTNDIQHLQKKVISPKRAKLIAENIYTKGAWKKLREEKRNFNKQVEYFNNDREKYLAKSNAIKNQPVTAEDEKAFKAEKDSLLARQTKLLQQKMDLRKKDNLLHIQCETPEAAKKINTIAQQVMLDNKAIFQRYRNNLAYAKSIKQKLDATQENFNIVKEQLKKEFSGTRYKVLRIATQNNLESIIAAMRKDPNASALVLRKEVGDNKKDWRLISDFEKEELELKAMLRDL